MLLGNRILEKISSGEVTLAFRRWRRPSVKKGGRLRTDIGELAIDELEEIKPSSLNDRDARLAGYESLAELKAELAQYREGQLYRIRVRLSGSDPRVRLREMNELSDLDVRTIHQRLAKFDESGADGPWTSKVLKLIAKHPELPAAQLAKKGGYEQRWLKIHVRKLKEIGLTISRLPGYRISPRGEAFLKRRDD